MKILEVKNLNIFYQYGIFFKKRIDVIKNLNFTLDFGENLGIFAPSGSGKTTLLKTITKLHTDYDGEIFINEKNIKDYEKKEFCSQFSITFQDSKSSFNPNFYVKKAILEGCNDLEFLEFLIQKFKISHLLDKNITKLSGGESTKVALIRALAKRPKVIFLDEINSSLDLINQLELLKLLREFNDFSFVIISHEMEFLRAICNKIIQI